MSVDRFCISSELCIAGNACLWPGREGKVRDEVLSWWIGHPSVENPSRAIIVVGPILIGGREHKLGSFEEFSLIGRSGLDSLCQQR